MEQTVSVIVPVYNCKEYLPRCIESILNQTYSQIQLLLVDDGSTDRSGEICDLYAAQDERILARHQNNGGVSKARNTGLALAAGDWILFVDADDYVDPDYCVKMLSAATSSNSDVVIARLHSSSQPDVQCYERAEIEQLKQTCLAYDETKFDYNIDGPWGKLFRRSLLEMHDIRFPETLSRSEDAYFCASVYEHTWAICCLNWFGYVHTEREGSLCRSFSPDSLCMLERILIENQEWVRRYHPEDSSYAKALWHRVLPGIDECERQYFLHKDNEDSIFSKIIQYAHFLNSRMVRRAIRSLRIRDVPKRQYKVRLLFYKMHLGWFFLLLKTAKEIGGNNDVD